ncbi:MAG: hypothetical protein HY686_00660 [Chloroflexi bacterium]|nr:hypothetical protein [Chloroflexota bacterium]
MHRNVPQAPYRDMIQAVLPFDHVALRYCKLAVYRILDVVEHGQRVMLNRLTTHEMRAQGHAGMFQGGRFGAHAFLEHRQDTRATWRQE